MDRDTFQQAVYLSWAERFNCAPEALHLPGTVTLPDAEFAATHAVHIWTIGARAFARVDPALETLIVETVGDRMDTAAIGPPDLHGAFGSAGIDRVEESVLRYLYPPDFRPTSPPQQMLVRTLTAADADALDALKATCTSAEVDEGEVSVDDEVGFACFDGPRLVAVATGFRLTGFMDIGVLTDPTYRRQGLGKAVVSALCAWCIDAPIIAQYRCLVTNTGSYAISESLGFSLTFSQHSIYLHPPAAH